MTTPIDDYPAVYQYRFCPRCATPLVRSTHDHVERQSCLACRWVHYPQPNLAATVVIAHAGGVVLAQRDIEPDRGMWHLPIGHVEFGETPEEGVVREAYEETGLELGPPHFLCYTYGRSYGDPRMFYLVLGFAATAVGGTLRGSAEGQATRVVAPDAMPPLKWNSQRNTWLAYLRWAGLDAALAGAAEGP